MYLMADMHAAENFGEIRVHNNNKIIYYTFIFAEWLKFTYYYYIRIHSRYQRFGLAGE